MEFEIEAKKLKHAISVLRHINDEGVMQIESDKVMCRVVDVANASIVQIIISSGAFEKYYTIGPEKVGIDFDKMASILKRATAKDRIVIEANGDDAWYFTRGIHQRSMSLLNPERLRKCLDMPELPHTVSVMLLGKEFKEIIAEAEEVGDGLRIHAGSDGVNFHAESKDVNPETYTATMSPNRVELFPNSTDITEGLYALEYLHDIAADMKMTDEILLQLGTDLPCEIEYTRDGVEVGFILAPRIEPDTEVE